LHQTGGHKGQSLSAILGNFLAADLASHIAFLRCSDAHRYRLIKSLNGLHM
jgi:hypothetical protein